MAAAVSSSSIQPSAKDTAFVALFIGDALSMPVHWYYDTDAIKRDYEGWLTGYRAPKIKHPSSMLPMASPSDSGRRPLRSTPVQYQAPVIGRIILHEKLKFWRENGDPMIHYHQGMKAGDNTLNALCSLKVAQAVSGADRKAMADPRVFLSIALQGYVHFMTTPGSHDDTYAESFHRAFFKDWEKAGKPTDAGRILRFAERRYQLKTMSGEEDSDIATIGGLVMAIPIILHCLNCPADFAARLAVDFVLLTNPARSVAPSVDIYARCVHAVAKGANLRETARRALASSPLGGMALLKRVESMEKEIRNGREHKLTSERLLRLHQSCTWELGSNCQMQGALKSLLFLAYMFWDNLEAALLTNANCGGENCHRGAALAALMACSRNAIPRGIPQHLIDGLGSSKADILQLLPLYEGLER